MKYIAMILVALFVAAGLYAGSVAKEKVEASYLKHITTGQGAMK